jgi:hypothetical protein
VRFFVSACPRMNLIRILAPDSDPQNAVCELADGTRLRGVKSAIIKMGVEENNTATLEFHNAAFELMAEADLVDMVRGALRGMDPETRRALIESEFWLDDLEAEAEAGLL